MGRVYKPVINMDSGDYRMIVCAWSDCERRGFENNKIIIHEHAKPIPCSSSLARHIHYVFCSERHRNMWGESSGWRAHRLAEQHNGQVHGMLPTGSRGGIL